MSDQVNKLASQMFQEIFNNLNSQAIKESVDERGIDKFIENAARIAAASGTIYIIPGLSLFGIPADIVNTVTQQFRVTLAVIYAKTGRYNPGFASFMAIVAISLGVEIGINIGMTIAKPVLISCARAVLVRLSVKVIPIPILGGALAAGANYTFIKAIGHTLKTINMGEFEQYVA
ncbi:MAG: hypothetical protein WA885_17145 [Phormidesmis sp.]